MRLNHLLQPHPAGVEDSAVYEKNATCEHAAASGAASPPGVAVLQAIVNLQQVVGLAGAAANDQAGGNANSEPVSGVVIKAGGGSEAISNRQAPLDAAAPKSQAELRTQAMYRFLSAQTDVSEDVLQLYKLVCTGFR